MKRFIFLASILLAFAAPPVLAALPTGAKAPTFNAPASQAGKSFHFSLKKALAEGPVVVYFYPAAYTGGCDLEAHTFATHQAQFTAAGATIIGVSADSIDRLNRFSSDPDYCAGKFPVASDPKGHIAAEYGLKLVPPRPGVTDVNGDPVKHGFIPRTTFVLDHTGKIIAVFSTKTDHIRPDQHVTGALDIVRKLQQ
jgi:peroxiredoxin